MGQGRPVLTDPRRRLWAFIGHEDHGKERNVPRLVCRAYGLRVAAAIIGRVDDEDNNSLLRGVEGVNIDGRRASDLVRGDACVPRERFRLRADADGPPWRRAGAPRWQRYVGAVVDHLRGPLPGIDFSE